jgi:hypothetical protein
VAFQKKHAIKKETVFGKKTFLALNKIYKQNQPKALAAGR